MGEAGQTAMYERRFVPSVRDAWRIAWDLCRVVNIFGARTLSSTSSTQISQQQQPALFTAAPAPSLLQQQPPLLTAAAEPLTTAAAAAMPQPAASAAPPAAPPPQALPGRPSEADPAAEMFEIFEETSPGAFSCVGLEPRSAAHKLGLLHKAVYVFVFDASGRLLLQRRSAAKSIGPGQWDLSVAEHLEPGESFWDGAARGLREELGIHAAPAAAPLGPMHRRSLVEPGRFVDNELVESFRLDGFAGEVSFNDAEVSEVRWVELPQLMREMEAHPDAFTEWFRAEVQLLGFFGAAAASTSAAAPPATAAAAPPSPPPPPQA